MSQGADSIVTFLDNCKRIYKRNFSYDVQIFIITHSHPSDFNRGNPHTRYVLTGLQRVVFLTATESNKAKIKV